MGILNKVFGSHSDREIKKIMPLVEKTESFESALAKLDEHQLKAKTVEFKERYQNGESLDDLLPEAFAVCREAAWRVLGMKHYQVQIIGGIVLHQGRIAEMRTGEGKTLVATLPVYLNALTGEGVHVVTVNDYLAKRDSEWMGKVYRYLGLSVGLIVHGISKSERRKAYTSDVTYGTNNEFGFDYLRDNMVTYKEDMVQRGHTFAIVDEVDSILIDEARTPLIISGQGDESTDMYQQADSFVKRLKIFVVAEQDAKMDITEISGDADYVVDEKAKTATLTPNGVEKAEKYFKVSNLGDESNFELQHYINNALKANGTMHLDDQYVIKDGEIVIVDDFTGRLMFGRRYSDGLHQAIEAKENVIVKNESKTLATITFQNYFRMYKKLSGMTGTALTEEEEFRSIYNLDVITIPTNKPLIRVDLADAVYKTQNGKYESLMKEVMAAHEIGQPLLIGTVSVEKSELLSKLFKRYNVHHSVLNAKLHEREAEIVAQAGRYGAVTIATNMAGRGTDILLGGNSEFMAKQELKKLGYSDELIEESTTHNETDDVAILDVRKKFIELERAFAKETQAEKDKVIAAGGLYIIGTERHESRRIDNQLRGRAGRQGDPGKSKFYLSLEDDLLRLFGGERMASLFDRFGVDEDMQIEHRMLTSSIESSQKRVEGRNFGIRKHVLEYDDVMNQQREVIYAQRRQVLDGQDLHDTYIRMISDTAESMVLEHCPLDQSYELWDKQKIARPLLDEFGALPIIVDLMQNKLRPELMAEEFSQLLTEQALERYQAREEELGSAEFMREAERVVMLQSVDSRWMDHIDAMDDLRNSIGMRGYAQHDPVIEYKREGFEMFEEMNHSITEHAVKVMMRAHFETNHPLERKAQAKNLQEKHVEEASAIESASAAEQPSQNQPGIASPMRSTAAAKTKEDIQPVKRDARKVGRNDPCPCGSGKKFKNCHGKPGSEEV